MNKNKIFLFFRIQLKSAFHLLPGFLVILFVSLLFFSGIYAAGRELMNRPDSIQMPVALVLPENDTYAGLAFSFLEHSMPSSCSFQRTDRDSALHLLQSGDVYAVILIPDSFVEHILNGTNSPATLILPREGSIESILFATLANAGTSVLSTAQAGIYAVENVLISYEKWDTLAKVEEELNKRYLSYALNRNRIFQTETVSATGSLTLTEYYLSSAIVLYLLLSGMGSYHYYQAEPASLRLLLSRQGISLSLRTITKTAAAAAVLFLLFFPLLVLSGRMPFRSCGGFFLLIFAVQAFLYLLSSFCPQSGSFIIISAVLSTLCLFVSGAFLPSVFLPETVRNLGDLLPSAFFLKLCRELLTDTFSLWSAMRAALLSALFLILSAVTDIAGQCRKSLLPSHPKTNERSTP